MVQAVMPFKNGGIAFILATIFGLFLFNGVGHMYIGKVRRGIGVFILGLFIYSVLFVFLIFTLNPNFGPYLSFHTNNNNYSLNFNNDIIPFGNKNIGIEHSMTFYLSLFFFGIVFFLYWIIQAADANRLAKKFNKHLDKTGELLWY